VRLPDFLVVAQERWDSVERRNQLLIRALSARNPQTRFLFVEAPARPRELGGWRPRPPRLVAPGIWVVRVARPLPNRASRAVSDRVEAAQIRRAARAVGLERPFLWTQDPRAADLIDILGVAGIVYDLTDDWAAFEREPARRSLVDGRIDRLLERADWVFACSRKLAEDAHRRGTEAQLLPNAVTPPPPAAAPLPEVLALPRPRLGYLGTLHSDRLDAGLVARAARLRPQWSFVLMGPDLLRGPDRATLLALPNVHYLGVRPHTRVPSFLAGLDLALLPNLVSDFTRSLDPLKMYEYLASGLPVIATPAGIAQEFRGLVTIATGAEELVAGAERELACAGEERREQLRAAVAGETWDARAQAVEETLGVRFRAPTDVEVSVVIVSYNTRDLLEHCLVELADQNGLSCQTIVVDNGSIDGSSELVMRRFEWAELVALERNTGFARANNLAFECCRGEFVLLLNSDAFLRKDALRQLVDTLRRHPEAGATGPRLLNPDGSLQRSAWPFPHPVRLLIEAIGLHRLLRRTSRYEDLATWAHDRERKVDFLIGACLLLRAEALAEVGGFDEGFWMYGEEADLQRRLSARGWSVVFTPDAACIHVGGASEIGSVPRLRHFYGAQFRFLRKHEGAAAPIVARLALIIGSLVRGRWRAAWFAIRLR
jgi:GT2 family glycosyltransferase/glycosyltransferase involved in cell wall biosynthesis